MHQVQLWLRDELPRLTLLGDLQSETYGVSVSARDLADGHGERSVAHQTDWCSAGILLILLVVVRRPWVAAPHPLATVLLS